MELKNFKLPEGVGVDFKPEIMSEDDVDFSDYFKNKSAEELKGIISGAKMRISDEYDYTIEYDDDDENINYSNSLLNRVLSKLKKMIGVL